MAPDRYLTHAHAVARNAALTVRVQVAWQHLLRSAENLIAEKVHQKMAAY